MTAEHVGRSSPVPPGQDPENENKTSTQYLEDTKNAHPVPEKVHHGDTALALFAESGGHEAIDPVENKRLVRKIDCMILPFLSVCYAFYYVSFTSHRGVDVPVANWQD